MQSHFLRKCETFTRVAYKRPKRFIGTRPEAAPKLQIPLTWAFDLATLCQI